jgi:Flp pilus assembly pilin Flp
MLLNTYVRLRTMMVCRKGQGLVEYLILITVVAVGLIIIITTFRNQLRTLFRDITDRLRNM